jgi:hypothetical protein
MESSRVLPHRANHHFGAGAVVSVLVIPVVAFDWHDLDDGDAGVVYTLREPCFNYWLPEFVNLR